MTNSTAPTPVPHGLFFETKKDNGLPKTLLPKALSLLSLWLKEQFPKSSLVLTGAAVGALMRTHLGYSSYPIRDYDCLFAMENANPYTLHDCLKKCFAEQIEAKIVAINLINSTPVTIKLTLSTGHKPLEIDISCLSIAQGQSLDQALAADSQKRDELSSALMVPITKKRKLTVHDYSDKQPGIRAIQKNITEVAANNEALFFEDPGRIFRMLNSMLNKNSKPGENLSQLFKQFSQHIHWVWPMYLNPKKPLAKMDDAHVEDIEQWKEFSHEIYSQLTPNQATGRIFLRLQQLFERYPLMTVYRYLDYFGINQGLFRLSTTMSPCLGNVLCILQTTSYNNDIDPLTLLFCTLAVCYANCQAVDGDKTPPLQQHMLYALLTYNNGNTLSFKQRYTLCALLNETATDSLLPPEQEQQLATLIEFIQARINYISCTIDTSDITQPNEVPANFGP